MVQPILPKITALVFGILIVCFAIGFYVIAWQEPSQGPPQGNVPAPINVGPTAQTKVGNLTIQGFLSTDKDLVVGNTTIKSDGTVSPNLNSDKLDDYNAADLMAQSAGGGVLVTWGVGTSSGTYPPPGEGAPACPSGWTEVYAGYGPFWLMQDEGVSVSTNCSPSESQVYRSPYGGWAAFIRACALTYGGLYYCNTCRVCVK